MENKNANREYKDGMFRSLFNDKERLLELYNALSGSNYPPDTPIEIVTLENVFFNGIKNDLAFIIDNRFIILAEQQSTLCPNIPLRMFCYLAKTYEKLISSKAIYSETLVKIPTPELYMFYNGPKEFDEKKIYRLSDSFIESCDIIPVELTVTAINVNYDKGAKLLSQCRSMQEYSLFIHKVRMFYHEYKDLDCHLYHIPCFRFC